MWRVDGYYEFDRLMAGYGPNNAGIARAMLRDVAESWCAGDGESAYWVIGHIWLRERLARWLRALAAVGPLVALTLGWSWWVALGVPVALLATRTRGAWAKDISGQWAPDGSRARSWRGRERLRRSLYRRRGDVLPAAAVLDPWAQPVLLRRLRHPDAQEIATCLAPEWHGTVGELVIAASALAEGPATEA